ncbi:MAG: hypothetical protein HN742_08100 [Lentisphaerae bacterium]|nr:hypothetical protein [Lentisphaerota bacterium]MBT4814820.1 hypothetical protein [Lentisphaerota bacterium]MBT5613064.1 hypothetical protein [Lentisphaerota bacterium]MBT7059323.1 hypothetical protein [Lentisphaerota bacterium]MBT7841819.1 hypothetical protein [Lentisphaerota bacterium]
MMVHRFEEYAHNPRGRSAVCFVATASPGVLSYRFLCEAISQLYARQLSVVGMGAWGERNWFKEMDIDMKDDSGKTYLPEFILADASGKLLGRLGAYTEAEELDAFFGTHLPGDQAEADTPPLRIDLKALFALDQLLSPYAPFSDEAGVAADAFLTTLAPQFSGLTSVSWLRDSLAAAQRLQTPTDRYALRRPVASLVKIAPDVASYCAELANWDSHRVYPVLLGNTSWTAKFIRAFEPDEIVQLEPGRTSSTSPTEPTILRTLLSSIGAVAEATPSLDDLNAQMIAASGGVPIGAVVIDPASPLALAGMALASARYQPVILASSPGPFESVPSFSAAEEMRKTMLTQIEALGVPYESYGDSLDGLTLACEFPFRYHSSPRDAERGIRALDDLLTRKNNGARWGIAGRLMGDAGSAVYRAMCSLFLAPRQALFFSRYSEGGAPWKHYSPRTAAAAFGEIVPCQTARHKEATIDRWKALTANGNRATNVFINSSGGAFGWSVSGGKAKPEDIPDSVPCQVHIIHSGSAARPRDPKSILGRWLEAGAHTYFGSMSEPLLEAFVTPDRVAARLFNGFPLGMAARSLLGPYSFPWRLVYFGDPLAPLNQELKKTSVGTDAP